MHYRVWFSIVLALAIVPSSADAQSIKRILQRVQLPIDLQRAQASGQLRTVNPAGDSAVVPSGATTIQLQDRAILVAAVGDSLVSALPGAEARIGDDAALGTLNDPEVLRVPVAMSMYAEERKGFVNFDPIIATESPRYRADIKRFRADFLITLAAREGSADAIALGDSISITLQSSADSVVPSELHFSRIGGRPQKVSLFVDAPGDSIDITLLVHTAPGNPITKRVAVTPTLLFVSAPTRIQGFGVEPRWVRVRRVGGRAAPEAVGLSGDGTTDTTMAIEKSGEYRALVRLEEPGRVELRASADGFATAVQAVEVVPPLRFLSAAGIGLLLALIATVVRTTEKARARPLLLCIIAGIVALALYVAFGINITSTTITGPLLTSVAVGVFTFLGGFGGGALLDALIPAKRT